MEIIETRYPTFTTLAPVGDLDANSSIYLDERLAGIIGRGEVNLHIDFMRVKYISSAGLGVFISYLDELAQKDGRFIFSDANEAVFDVMELLGLNQIVPVVNHAEDAASMFEEKQSK